MRKLATIRQIAEIKPIENADAIEAYRVDGWWVVDKKGAHTVGDCVVYIEIDSWIPHEVAPFLSKGKDPREYEGIKGERLRTVKLRGQVSQGLLLPVSVGFGGYLYIKNAVGEHCVVQEGQDVTDLLGIVKWDPPIPAVLSGAARGNFPGWCRKTDQERIQNVYADVAPLFDEDWAQEEKLDGSSMSVGYRKVEEQEELHICSRNLSLKVDEMGNSFVRIAHETGLIDAIQKLGRNICVSGELCGEGIQGNKYKLKGQQFFVFDILNVDTQTYVSVTERSEILTQLAAHGFKVQEVPKIAVGPLTGHTVDTLLQMAEAKTSLGSGAEREGIVFKNVKNPDMSFKAISNRFLLKGGD